GEALANAREKEAAGFTFSYDMLGEAALTAPDAARYHEAYAQAIDALAAVARSSDIRANPGISIKLSALHPRYHYAQRERVMDELVPRVLSLAKAASAAHIGLNIDAEEADRLDLSLDVIETVLADPGLAGWEGFGIVVQAYGQRARPLLTWIDALAEALERRVMVRLVKGAYWDTEIKRAQILGIERFPVFTRKAATDVSYIANARLLLAMSGRVYPQFATHNAHTAAAVLHMAGAGRDFEFQRLHGMGEALHDHLHAACGVRSRIYAPVGAHEDLLAYLVRRLLENGANSSFVNQIIDEDVPPEEVAADPFEKIARAGAQIANPLIVRPPDLFGERRRNSKGYDLADPLTMADLKSARTAFASHVWRACPLIAAPADPLPERDIVSPADPACRVGHVAESSPADVEAALSCAAPWAAPVAERAAVLQRASDLFEAHAAELHALAAREAGKTWPDCVSEVREAVDFLRYYAEAAREQGEGEPRGIFTCISPWNFPLAIFTGQIAAALATGNGVLAKPAEATPLIAMRAVELLHAAGVPRAVLQLLPGEGGTVGAALTSDPRVDGVCFTGSTATAQAINRAMAQTLDPLAPLIAETGGINAMIVDSTALPEQAVRDILASAFQSAGQRCSALRVLYLQNDIADRILEMLFGAMDELALGDPQLLKTDIGPLIDAEAQRSISAYVEAARDAGRLLKQLTAPRQGFFVGPAVIAVS
ncbi:MAG: bifunctional proline dehydrogenase/L-glutamate gamma-semialdehyde dehydrogenase PutA, partial [Alphaproteobacteria bacterium]